MAANETSPSAVMYDELKSLGCKKHDVAVLLLDTDKRFGDTTMLDRIESPSQLTRYVVQVAPGELSERFFRDFDRSVPAVLSLIAKKRAKGDVRKVAPDLVDYLRGEAGRAMQEALAAFGRDASVYRNAVSHIDALPLESDVQRALLHLMLFVVAGCTGDPHRAAQAAADFADQRIGEAFRTIEAHVGSGSGSSSMGEDSGDDAVAQLGLMRIVHGKLKAGAPAYRLNTSASGTVIGTLAAGPDAITDVDADVSREHARIYLEGGRWYIVGLKSTNGTTVISGADKSVRTVEPPRAERSRGYVPEPVELLASDTICLGSSTRFLVMPIW